MQISQIEFDTKLNLGQFQVRLPQPENFFFAFWYLNT